MSKTNLSLKKIEKRPGKNCPYMDTIERKALDFDFDKLCSISLTRDNIYACLICGVFLNGRWKKTNAYYHSVNLNHHIFIHLKTKNVYCLPDGYLIEDPSLNDIKHVLNPYYNKNEIENVLSKENYSSSLDGVIFIPGRIGINNLGETDYINSVLQGLFSVTPFVKFFLDPDNFKLKKSKLLNAFSELTRKFFNPRNFKPQISPQEFLQVIDEVSKGKFKIGNSSDPLLFLTWLLNSLNSELKEKNNKSIITKLFQGNLNSKSKLFKSNDLKTKNRIIPFFHLSLDLPPTPLYRGEDVEEFIPQVPIYDLLNKYNGKKSTKVGTFEKTYSLMSLPRYLILVIKRFIQNDFRPEKNPTIVNFPIKNLELSNLIEKSNLKELKKMDLKELKKILKFKKNIIVNKTKIKKLSKDDVISLILENEKKLNEKFDLICNIIHEGDLPNHGINKSFVFHKANNKWYETQDLTITETLPQLVTVSETYIQIWEKKL